MRDALPLLLTAALLAGCGGDDGSSTTTPPADSGSGDGSKGDTATGDAPADAATDEGIDVPKDSGGTETLSDAPADSGTKDSVADVAKDTSPGGDCAVDTDCRLFSSYCDGTKLKLCACYAFPKAAPDPICDGKTGTCFVDPCLTYSAWCNAGTCDLKKK